MIGIHYSNPLYMYAYIASSRTGNERGMGFGMEGACSTLFDQLVL